MDGFLVFRSGDFIEEIVSLQNSWKSWTEATHIYHVQSKNPIYLI